jgi:Zn-dependent protease
MDEGSQVPPLSGEYIAPPAYPVTADIPPESPYHRSPAPTRRQSQGLLGGIGAAVVAAFAYGKYVLLLMLKVPLLASLGSMFLSLGLYAIWAGPWGALGIVAMIYVHEMGHVIEIRRQGMAATAPIFIPFVGAAIFQRSHAQSPMKQAQIGIAGPIAGTVGAVTALVLYASTHWIVFLVWAHFGFLINLFNLIPFGMLDGGWILAPVSKWFQVAGLAVLAGMVLFTATSPILILIVLLGLPMVFQRFRNPKLDAYMTSEPASVRYAMGAAWLLLVAFLAFTFFQTDGMLQTLVR